MAFAVNVGRRSALLVVDGTRLRAETSSLFGATRLEWDRAEVPAIRADTSSVEVGWILNLGDSVAKPLALRRQELL